MLGGVNVEHLPPEHPLTAANVANAGEPFLEEVTASGPLESGIVQREPLDEVFAQPLGRPNTELRAAMRTDAVADGQNGVEVVMVHGAGNLAISLALNYSEFPNSCGRIEFAVVVNALQMFVYRGNGYLEQVGEIVRCGSQIDSCAIRTSIRVCPSSV